MAERLTLQRHLLLVFVGLMLQQVGRAVSSTSAVDVGFVAAAVLLYSIGVLLMSRDVRRAERFLRRHPAPLDGEVVPG
jgi:threonine/homoserine efflux transporter RhtA